MCAVSLQFKILCKRIDRNTWRSCKNIDSFTNNDMEPIGIKPRVKKYLWNFFTATNEYTDGLAPIGILPRVAKKLQNFATFTDRYTVRLAPVSI